MAARHRGSLMKQAVRYTDRMAATRYTVHFSGRVQGVGFRFTAGRVAKDFDVAGYVQNLPDGRVRLVAEGEAEELDRYIDALSNRMSGNISDTSIDKSGANGEFGRPGAGIHTRR